VPLGCLGIRTHARAHRTFGGWESGLVVNVVPWVLKEPHWNRLTLEFDLNSLSALRS